MGSLAESLQLEEMYVPNLVVQSRGKVVKLEYGPQQGDYLNFEGLCPSPRKPQEGAWSEFLQPPFPRESRTSQSVQHVQSADQCPGFISGQCSGRLLRQL